MASVGITGATSERGCRWRRWWSTRIGGTGWSSTTRRPRGSWAGTSTRADGGEAFHRHAVTVMLAYSFLVWQEWQQRQERARPGRPRRAFSPSGGSASQDAAGNPSADLRLATPRGGQYAFTPWS